MSWLTGVTGLAIFVLVVWDAIETILVPRRIGRRFRLTRAFYVVTWPLWRSLALGVKRVARREAILGFYGPLSLVLLLFCWAAGLILSFALLGFATHGMGARSPADLLYMSGETFFTLGFGDLTPQTGVGRLLAVVESGLGFAFLGTVVGYLPTMYGAFSQREIEISLMDARAGSPPTAAEFLRRTPQPAESHEARELMRDWERWAVQVLESHISYPQVAFYRSQHVNQSWLGSLTMILDSTAAILARTGDGRSSQARRTFAMARHALVDITQVFVQEFRAPGAERMNAEQMHALRAALDDAGIVPAAPDEFESRFAALRLLYEPYAQALAAFLVIDLPPFARLEPRRDNWERGPWDRMLPGTEEALRREDHF